MSTPQDPPDPQDPQGPPNPQDPQNPYGAPPPPPAEPYGQPPAQPAYGEPPAQPSYGQAPAYQPGQPGQPGQPYPQYGAPPPGGDAPKGMAITALILSFLGCTGILAIVSIVLAVVVLLRGKDGRNHGKGLAITAIIVSVVTFVIAAVAVVALGVFVGSLAEVDDLKTGDCVTAEGLVDESSDSVTNIRVVECAEKHDGEVITTSTLTAAQAAEYLTDPSVSVCVDAITAAGKAELITESLTVTALAEPDPEEGDKVACIAYNVDGSQLTGKLGS